MRNEAMHAERSIKPLSTKSFLPSCHSRYAQPRRELFTLPGNGEKVFTLPGNGDFSILERSIKPVNTKSFFFCQVITRAMRNRGENSSPRRSTEKTFHLAGQRRKSFHLAGQRRFFNSADQRNLETFDKQASLDVATGIGRYRCRLIHCPCRPAREQKGPEIPPRSGTFACWAGVPSFQLWRTGNLRVSCHSRYAQRGKSRRAEYQTFEHQEFAAKLSLCAMRSEASTGKTSTLPGNGENFHLAGQRRFFNSADQPRVASFRAPRDPEALRGTCRLHRGRMALDPNDCHPLWYFPVLGKAAELSNPVTPDVSGEALRNPPLA